MDPGAARPDGNALARRIEWRIWRAGVLANLVGVLFIAFDAAATGPVLPAIGDGRLVASTPRLLLMCAAVAVPYFALSASLGVRPRRRAAGSDNDVRRCRRVHPARAITPSAGRRRAAQRVSRRRDPLRRG
ncbi:MAG: hypothetical protein ACRDKJ_13995 [Actinomycetota bacterium]